MKFKVLLRDFFMVVMFSMTLEASRVDLEVTPDAITPDISTNLTLCCSVRAGAASGAIIGRSLDTQIGRSLGDQTTELQYITAMVITHEGRDIATQTEHLQASLYDVTPGVHVTGQLTPAVAEQGFLQLSWRYPGNSQLGRYGCNVTGVDKKGHSYEFFKSVNVGEAEVTIKLLAKHILELKKDRDQMAKENVLLKQRVDDLENKQIPEVFFSAVLSKATSVGLGQVLVYDLVLSSKGNGYNSSTGVFTSPVSGFYTFQISGLANIGKTMGLRLLKNNDQVISIWSRSLASDSHAEGTSNSACVFLAQGDTAKVVSYFNPGSSTIWSSASDTHTTFNGHLVGLP